MSEKSEITQQTEPDFAGEIINVPTTYIDGMQGAAGVAGVIKLNLYQYVQDFTDPSAPVLKREMVGRLAMSEATLVGVYDWLTDIVSDIRERTQPVSKDGSE